MRALLTESEDCLLRLERLVTAASIDPPVDGRYIEFDASIFGAAWSAAAAQANVGRPRVGELFTGFEGQRPTLPASRPRLPASRPRAIRTMRLSVILAVRHTCA